MRAPGARGYRLVYLYKADGGPHVCLLFAFRNCPIATPHRASEVHSRGGPDFKGIAPPNHLRTRGSGWITSIQIRRSIRLRTRATWTKKWILGGAIFSAHFALTRSKDLLACPVLIHSDSAAARLEANFAAQPGSSPYGALSEPKWVLHNHVAAVLRSGEQRSARASPGPSATGSPFYYAASSKNA